MTETVAGRFQVRPASPVIGAEIEGVDLTRHVDKATVDALREAFWANKVLVFRSQNLSPLQHVRPGRGTLRPRRRHCRRGPDQGAVPAARGARGR